MKPKNTIFIIIAILFCTSIKAQVSYVENNNLKFNSATNCQIRYIYFPNMGAYFDKLNNDYIFQEKGEWIKAKELPTLYGGYSIYSNVGVEIKDYEEEQPFSQIKQHKKQFPYCSKGHFTYQTVAIN